LEIGQRFDFDKISNCDVEFAVSRSALEDKKPERSRRNGVKEKKWREDESKSTSVVIGVEKLNMRVNTYVPCTCFITSAAIRDNCGVLDELDCSLNCAWKLVMEYADISGQLHCYVHYRMTEVGLHDEAEKLSGVSGRSTSNSMCRARH